MSEHHLRAVADRPCKDDDRETSGLAALGNFGGKFAPRRLVVETALGSNDQVCVTEVVIKLEQWEECVEAGSKLGAQQGVKARPNTPRGAATRHFPDVDAERPLNNVGIIVERGGEPFDILGAGALLRAKQPSDAVFSGQHVPDIATDLDLHLAETRIEPRHIDCFKRAEPDTAALDLIALAVQQACTHGLR